MSCLLVCRVAAGVGERPEGNFELALPLAYWWQTSRNGDSRIVPQELLSLDSRKRLVGI